MENTVLDYFRGVVDKAGGGNYQTLINEALLEHVHRRSTLDVVRQVVREELAGGLLSYGQLGTERFLRAATYVDRILKGARPGDLPVEQPSAFELVLNLKTARALKLEIPPSVRFRATRIVE